MKTSGDSAAGLFLPHPKISHLRFRGENTNNPDSIIGFNDSNLNVKANLPFDKSFKIQQLQTFFHFIRKQKY
jgi:hypothetical protein